MVVLIGLGTLIGIFWYEFRVPKITPLPKTLSFIGWRMK